MHEDAYLKERGKAIGRLKSMGDVYISEDDGRQYWLQEWGQGWKVPEEVRKKAERGVIVWRGYEWSWSGRLQKEECADPSFWV